MKSEKRQPLLLLGLPGFQISNTAQNFWRSWNNFIFKKVKKNRKQKNVARNKSVFWIKELFFKTLRKHWTTTSGKGESLSMKYFQMFLDDFVPTSVGCTAWRRSTSDKHPHYSTNSGGASLIPSLRAAAISKPIPAAPRVSKQSSIQVSACAYALFSNRSWRIQHPIGYEGTQ